MTTFEHINCDFCGSSSFDEVTEQTDLLYKMTTEMFKVVKCRDCDLSFVNPRPTKSSIGKYYSTSYSFHSKRTLLQNVARVLFDWVANRNFGYLFAMIPRISTILKAYVKPSISDPVLDLKVRINARTFLDIGCGSGEHAHFWGSKGSIRAYRERIQVWGVEVDEKSRLKLSEEEGIPCYPNLESVPSELKFDIIRLNWSLEHVHEPSKYFRFLSERLSPSGRVLIMVPNFNGLLYKMIPSCVEVPIHLYHFTPKSLENYAGKFGLKVESMQTFSYPGMYAFCSNFFPELKVFESATYADFRKLQESFAIFDRAGFGNDIIMVLKP